MLSNFQIYFSKVNSPSTQNTLQLFYKQNPHLDALRDAVDGPKLDDVPGGCHCTHKHHRRQHDQDLREEERSPENRKDYFN